MSELTPDYARSLLARFGYHSGRWVWQSALGQSTKEASWYYCNTCETRHEVNLRKTPPVQSEVFHLPCDQDLWVSSKRRDYYRHKIIVKQLEDNKDLLQTMEDHIRTTHEMINCPTCGDFVLTRGLKTHQKARDCVSAGRVMTMHNLGYVELGTRGQHILQKIIDLKLDALILNCPWDENYLKEDMVLAAFQVKHALGKKLGYLSVESHWNDEINKYELSYWGPPDLAELMTNLNNRFPQNMKEVDEIYNILNQWVASSEGSASREAILAVLDLQNVKEP